MTRREPGQCTSVLVASAPDAGSLLDGLRAFPGVRRLAFADKLPAPALDEVVSAVLRGELGRQLVSLTATTSANGDAMSTVASRLRFALARMPRLRELNLAECGLSLGAALAVAKGVAGAWTSGSLDLSGNAIGASAEESDSHDPSIMDELARQLVGDLGRVTSLRMRECGLADSDIKSLCDALCGRSAVSCLDLGATTLSEASLTLLGEALSKCRVSKIVVSGKMCHLASLQALETLATARGTAVEDVSGAAALAVALAAEAEAAAARAAEAERVRVAEALRAQAEADAAKAAADKKKADDAKAAADKKKADDAKAAADKKKADDAKAAADKKKADDAKAAADKKKADDAKAAKDKEEADAAKAAKDKEEADPAKAAEG